MAEAPSQLFPNVPTLKAAAGSRWLSGVWRGIAAPKDLPKAVEERLIAAVKKAYDSKEYREFMTARGFGMRYLPPQEFAALMTKTDAENGMLMKKFGMTQ
jgi:tripartite-type tricarboxylate transporter receptor subunit TctC